MIAAQSSSLNMDAKFKKTPIGEIPVEWEVSTIGQCAGVNLFTIPDNTPDNKKIRYIDISSIEKTGSISGIRDLFYRDAPSRARRKIEAGDILVSTVRPYLRAFAMVHDNGGDLIASTGFAVLSSTGVNGEFLYQFVLSEPFAQFLTERMTGSNYPAVNSSDVALCPIPLPPTQEQKKIADILSSVDDAIQKADAVIAKTRDLKKALMQRLLTRGIAHTKFKKTPIGEIPVEWKTDKLKNLGEIITGGTPAIKEQRFWNGDFMFVTPSDIDVRRFIHSTTRHLSQEGLKVSRIIPKNAVMVTCIASIGKMALATEDCCTNQQINSVICNENIEPIFLFYSLKNQEDSLKNLAGQTAVPIVNKTLFGLLDVAIPSISEQKKIAEILSSVDDAIEKSESERDHLEQTKKSLMADLLTGRVRTV